MLKKPGEFDMKIFFCFLNIAIFMLGVFFLNSHVYDCWSRPSTSQKIFKWYV